MYVCYVWISPIRTVVSAHGFYESEPSPSIPEAESPHSDKPDPDTEDCDCESSEGTMVASQCGCGSCEHGPGDPERLGATSRIDGHWD